MNDNQLDLKSINKILTEKFNFIVKPYQRGYKWKTQQVEDLLNDISEFKKTTESAFYCLQPIVVKQEGDKWELIDGQQRLTTIFIILSVLDIQQGISIDYTTRTASILFLQSLAEHSIQPSETWSTFIGRMGADYNHIDIYHFFNAYQTTANWFKENTAEQQTFIDNLLEHTQVIWYQINQDPHKDSNTDSRDIFMRLNSGKIPLTNAELIKALFINVIKDKNQEAATLKQSELAQEWDKIECALQNNEFWSFINQNPQKNTIATRIEFIFDLITNKPNENQEQFFSFYYYQKELNVKTHQDEWKKVKDCFLQLQEWFEDNKLYHLIGFIIHQKIKLIKDLLTESKNLTKTEFALSLEIMIGKAVKKHELNKLSYGEDNDSLTAILLLFNIDILLQENSISRFSFEQFKSKQWSLEHIHAQHSKQLDDDKELNTWLSYAIPIINNINNDKAHQLKESLAKIREDQRAFDKKKDEISKLRTAFVNLFGDANELDETETLHGIENLALLDTKTNSALNNNIFPSKREEIIDKDRNGLFIPIATKNVFLKYYSPQVVDVYTWSALDRKHYQEAIAATLKKYTNLSK